MATDDTVEEEVLMIRFELKDITIKRAKGFVGLLNDIWRERGSIKRDGEWAVRQ